MKLAEWRIFCNVLKNRLDSYGISVVVPIQLPQLTQSSLNPLLFDASGRLRAGLVVPNLKSDCLYGHVTLRRIVRSTFVLPAEPHERDECLRLLQLLGDTVPREADVHNSWLLERLLEAKITSRVRAERLTQGQWKGLKLPVGASPRSEGLLAAPVMLIEVQPRLLATGNLILKIGGAFLHPSTVLLIERLFGPCPGEVYDCSHVTLGFVDSCQAVTAIQQALEAIGSSLRLEVLRGEAKVVGYRHRSLTNTMYRVPLRSIERR